MKTQAYPYKEIAPNTFEIGEFDCASMFLLIGDEKAMLIDTGIGIGDLTTNFSKLSQKIPGSSLWFAGYKKSPPRGETREGEGGGSWLKRMFQ